jgi:flagella basal body P-ring formation protein FlgA
MNHLPPRLPTAIGQCLAVLSLVIGILFSGTGVSAVEPRPVRVDVQENSSVDRDMIQLGDIADISGDDQKLVRQLKAVPVGRSPLPGSSRNLSEGELRIRLKQAGVDEARIHLTTPAPANVTRNTVTIKGSQIEKLVEDFIRQNVTDPRVKMTIKKIQVPGEVVLPSGRVRYEVTSGPRGEMLGTFSVGITFRVNEAFEKKVWAKVNIEVLVDAVMTVRALGRYRPITAGDIEVRQVDLSELPPNAVTDPEEVIGKRTKRAVYANRVLSTDLVELPPLVKRGDLVTIIARLEGLKITTLGEVKRKGRQGERIPVLNIDSRKVIFARVIDANTVAVEF